MWHEAVQIDCVINIHFEVLVLYVHAEFLKRGRCGRLNVVVSSIV